MNALKFPAFLRRHKQLCQPATALSRSAPVLYRLDQRPAARAKETGKKAGRKGEEKQSDAMIYEMQMEAGPKIWPICGESTLCRGKMAANWRRKKPFPKF